jgi:hypothetical protein
MRVLTNATPSMVGAESQTVRHYTNSLFELDALTGNALAGSFYLAVEDNDGNLSEWAGPYAIDGPTPIPALGLKVANGSSTVVDIDTGTPIPDGTYTVLTVPVGDIAAGTIRRHTVTLTGGIMSHIENAAYDTLDAEFHVVGFNAGGTVKFHAVSAVEDIS